MKRLGVDVGGTFTDLIYVDDESGIEILYGGIPARPFADGLDGHSWWPLFKAVPTEYLEKYYPLRVESYRARSDSGGAGYHRGGHGIAKEYRFLEDGFVTYQDDRAQTYPWGINGGRHGARSEKTLIRSADGPEVRLPSKVENVPVFRGDRLIFSTAGAGGLGDPLTRETERIAADVRAGLVNTGWWSRLTASLTLRQPRQSASGRRPAAVPPRSSTSARCHRSTSSLSRSPRSAAASTPG